jgi:hypothetical protein
MKRTTARYLTTLAAGLLSLSLVACASHKAKDAATVDGKTAAVAKEKKQQGPAAMGYAIMNSSGEPLYCKRIVPTGSNLVRTTKCLTAKEWQQKHNEDQQTLEELRKDKEYRSAK